MLPNDYCRCHERDNTCPSKAVCQRYTDKGTTPDRLTYAAFPQRREAGASACESFIRHGVDVLSLETLAETSHELGGY